MISLKYCSRGYISEMKVEAIMERKADDVSLDMLSRLLVDVHSDSSKILNDLLSVYQRSLLSMVFCGDEFNRCKYNLVICEGIDPKLNAEEYMDRGDNENELKQVPLSLHICVLLTMIIILINIGTCA